MISSMDKTKSLRAIKALLSLRDRRTWGPFVEAYETTRFDYSFGVSWSQSGEDLSILPLLAEIENGRYLDIGAHHPTRFSVTRHLFQRGWSGVNVDANHDLIQEFIEARPNDVSINFCVGNESVYQLSVFHESAISTVNPIWDERFKNEQNLRKTVRSVPGISLRKLLDDYFPIKGPHFMNIDIEGADFDALTSGDLGGLSNERRPLWILVESIPPAVETLQTDTVRLLLGLDYEIWLILPFACLLKNKLS